MHNENALLHLQTLIAVNIFFGKGSPCEPPEACVFTEGMGCGMFSGVTAHFFTWRSTQSIHSQREIRSCPF